MAKRTRLIGVVVTAEDGTTDFANYFIAVTRPKPIVERTILTPTVVPGGTVDVTLTFGPGSASSGTRETLPDGFSWIPGVNNPKFTPSYQPPGQTEVFEVLALGDVDDLSYTYQLRASDTPDVYTITGFLRTMIA